MTTPAKQVKARIYYEKNRAVVIARAKQWRLDHPIEFKASRDKHRAEHREEIRERNNKIYRPRYKERESKVGKNRRWMMFLACVDAYGGCCACCGESNPIFLTLDHINNDGATKRKTLKAGSPTYRRLKKDGYPKTDFQLLCWNCNCGKQRNGGHCPHKDEPK